MGESINQRCLHSSKWEALTWLTVLKSLMKFSGSVIKTTTVTLSWTSSLSFTSRRTLPSLKRMKSKRRESSNLAQRSSQFRSSSTCRKPNKRQGRSCSSAKLPRWSSRCEGLHKELTKSNCSTNKSRRCQSFNFCKVIQSRCISITHTSLLWTINTP